MLLRVEAVSKSFGGFVAVRDVSLSVDRGRTACVIGPNGAGKSTLFNLITGHLQPTRGRVFFGDRDITGRAPHVICRMGIGRSFQRTNIFPRLSVYDNVQVAVLSHLDRTLNMMTPARTLVRDETLAVLEAVGLTAEAQSTSGTLSYGLQKQLELGIALASEPRVLLLDEPTAGMSPQETADTIALIGRIVRERGLTLLFTEHDMDVVFNIAERITVLHQGAVLAEGTPDEVQKNENVQRIYLGESGMTLEVSDIYTAYGLSQILFGVSLTVERGECVALLGRNGVGKTTTLRSIMGLTAPYRGTVRYNGADITGRPAYQVAKLGLGFVPEERRIFPDLTVRQNLEVARKAPASPHARQWTVEAVFETFPTLTAIADRKGGFLSGGEQQMLTIGRTLMGNPDMLLLDEPSEGLAPLIVRDLGRQIGRLKEQGLTILLCEQNAKFATRLSDRTYILEKGHVRFSGSIEALHANDEVRRQYLGV